MMMRKKNTKKKKSTRSKLLDVLGPTKDKCIVSYCNERRFSLQVLDSQALNRQSILLKGRPNTHSLIHFHYSSCGRQGSWPARLLRRQDGDTPFTFHCTSNTLSSFSRECL